MSSSYRWGGTPAIAIFASNHRYKRESYRGSEFAARVLADSDIPVVMKVTLTLFSTSCPPLNSMPDVVRSPCPAQSLPAIRSAAGALLRCVARNLYLETCTPHTDAATGLPPHLALSSVTSVPAAAAGMSHRIGILQEGADADVVLWDSHPLQLGATPRKVWIDGILQLGADEDGVVVGKGKDDPALQDAPSVPNWDKERGEAVKWEGLPPLAGEKRTGRVVFKNVSEVIVRAQQGVKPNLKKSGTLDVVVDAGKVACTGSTCARDQQLSADIEVDLQGGSIVPGMMSFGSPLGIEEIAGESSTGDGSLYDPFRGDVPGILGDESGVVRAVDALKFETRNALYVTRHALHFFYNPPDTSLAPICRLAHRAGVTHATSSLAKSNLFAGSAYILAGLSATFRTGSTHALEPGAIIKDVTALHVAIGRTPPFADAPRVSVSTQVAALRRLLLGGEPEDTETGYWFGKAAQVRVVVSPESSRAFIC